MMSKESIKQITGLVGKQDVRYVKSVSEAYEVIKAEYPLITESQDERDVLFVLKLMAFSDKIKVLHWSAPNNSVHERLDEFSEELEKFKDAISENIQGIIGQFQASQFKSIELPVADNAVAVIVELRDVITEWNETHVGSAEYEGCRNLVSGMLELIYKYLYLLGLCK